MDVSKTLGLAFVVVGLMCGCSKDKSSVSSIPFSGSGSGGSGGGGAGGPGGSGTNSILSENCDLPFVEAQPSEGVAVQTMARPQGRWVLKTQSSFYEIQLLQPEADVLNGLSLDLRHQFNEMAARKNQVSLSFDMASVNSELPQMGNTVLPYKFICSTLKAPVNSNEEQSGPGWSSSESEKTNNSQTLTTGFPFIVAAPDLGFIINANMKFKYDGRTPEFGLALAMTEGKKSWLDTSNKTPPPGVRVHYVKVSETVYKMQIIAPVVQPGRVTLSAKGHQATNGWVYDQSENSVELEVPVRHTFAAEAVYELKP